MEEHDDLPKPIQNQLRTQQQLVNPNADRILAVDLHKAKFDQRKAVAEYQSDGHIVDDLPGDVYDRSQQMITARGDDSSSMSVEDGFTEVAEEDIWIGSIPVQMYREDQEVLLRGFPYLIGFANGQPR